MIEQREGDNQTISSWAGEQRRENRRKQRNERRDKTGRGAIQIGIIRTN